MNVVGTTAPRASSRENATAYQPVGKEENGNRDNRRIINQLHGAGSDDLPASLGGAHVVLASAWPALVQRSVGFTPGRVAHALFIVPQAHVRLDRTFQTEMYELFHRRAPARWGHLLCTPMIVVALLAALAAAVPGSDLGPVVIDGALVGAAVIALWSLWVDRAAGLVVLPLVIAAALGARELASALGEHAALLALALAWAGGFVQAASHGSEPIPPPWTGSHRFMPLGEFLRTATLPRIAGLALLAPTVFTLLEVWAAPRVWVLQALHLMMRAGYRAPLRERLERRVDEMLADARTGWAQPELGSAA